MHETIFDAFDREEEHVYEFRAGGKYPRVTARTDGSPPQYPDWDDDDEDDDE